MTGGCCVCGCMALKLPTMSVANCVPETWKHLVDKRVWKGIHFASSFSRTFSGRKLAGFVFREVYLVKRSSFCGCFLVQLLWEHFFLAPEKYNYITKSFVLQTQDQFFGCPLMLRAYLKLGGSSQFESS